MVSLEPESRLAKYRAELSAFRDEYGGAAPLPDVPFFLFGMGGRTKLIYHGGVLKDAMTGEVLRSWDVEREIILPPEYAVYLTTRNRGPVRIVEDATAVWLEEDGERTLVAGTESPLNLPSFSAYRYPQVLRVLHQEVLVNVIDGLPVPNFFAYAKPWYRDAALMAMVLVETGNLDLIEDWVLGIDTPYDRNNEGETEADNLGQGLYLVSLFSDKNHPLVKRILDEIPRFEVEDENGKYILGRSDFADHPVYQTKWLKYGLRALGLPDPYTIPDMRDSYSALFWMDYRDSYVAGSDSRSAESYPYLDWGADHYHGTKRSPISNQDYPLTWECEASQAAYNELERLAPVYVEKKLAAPHTWHGAEIFLYLTDRE